MQSKVCGFVWRFAYFNWGQFACLNRAWFCLLKAESSIFKNDFIETLCFQTWKRISALKAPAVGCFLAGFHLSSISSCDKIRVCVCVCVCVQVTYPCERGLTPGQHHDIKECSADLNAQQNICASWHIISFSTSSWSLGHLMISQGQVSMGELSKYSFPF